MPIMSWDGLTCLGMIGVATPAESVTGMIRSSVVKNLLIMLLALSVTTWFILHFTSGLIDVIKKTMSFLTEISEGNLSADIDQTVIQRPDELGEMGRLTLKLRGSLRKLIEKDTLTGIYNRRYGSNKLEELIEKGIPYSLAMGDIDYFKKFNDNYGHECGDAVLISVSRTLGEYMRQYGFAARWGGEEFLLVYENMSGLAASVATEKLLDRIREDLVEYNGSFHSVTMSFGVAEGRGELSMDENVNAADAKLYIAKENGRNQVVS
jgi:diguanylate cyclase (GGDEF)-like protein